MKLRRLVIFEIAAVIIALVLVMVFVEITPYLISSAQDASIGIYNEKEFGRGDATIVRGQIIRADYFNYTTFDPAILVLDLDFQSFQSTGNLTIAVNGKVFASVFVSPEKPRMNLNVISVSGADWVSTNSIYSPVFGNAISFTSDVYGGYEGTFNYQISIRGSR